MRPTLNDLAEIVKPHNDKIVAGHRIAELEAAVSRLTEQLRLCQVENNQLEMRLLEFEQPERSWIMDR